MEADWRRARRVVACGAAVLRCAHGAAHTARAAKRAQTAQLVKRLHDARSIVIENRLAQYSNDTGLAVLQASADDRVAVRRRQRVHNFLVLVFVTSDGISGDLGLHGPRRLERGAWPRRRVWAEGRGPISLTIAIR